MGHGKGDTQSVQHRTQHIHRTPARTPVRIASARMQALCDFGNVATCPLDLGAWLHLANYFELEPFVSRLSLLSLVSLSLSLVSLSLSLFLSLFLSPPLTEAGAGSRSLKVRDFWAKQGSQVLKPIHQLLFVVVLCILLCSFYKPFHQFPFRIRT